MTLLDAHASFFSRGQEAWIVQAEHDGVDVSAAATTALAKLSGQLDACTTDDELDAAAAAGWEHYQRGRFGPEQLDRMTRLVLITVVEFGQQQCGRR